MLFTSDFVTGQADLLRRSGKAHERAWGDNLEIEERLAEGRVRAYEAFVAETGRDSLPAAHAIWSREQLQKTWHDPAEPFRPGNSLATFDPGNRERQIIRLENLSVWCDKGAGRIRPYSDVEVERAFKEKDSGKPADIAMAYLETFFAYWNTRRDGRPAFAAFAEDLDTELAGNDSIERLWRPLGVPMGRGQTQPRQVLLGLMELTVGEILDALPASERPAAFAAPTVLDTDRFKEYFFPSPRPRDGEPISCGWALHLDASAQGMVHEMIHRPIPYKVEHLKRLLWVTPTALPDLPVLRAAHLGRLQRICPGFAAHV